MQPAEQRGAISICYATDLNSFLNASFSLSLCTSSSPRNSHLEETTRQGGGYIGMGRARQVYASQTSSDPTRPLALPMLI